MAVRERFQVRGDGMAVGFRADGRAGILSDERGDSVVACPADLLTALQHTLDHECGPAANAVLRSIGRRLGESLAEKTQRELAARHSAPLHDLSTAVIHASLSSALANAGWGRADWDWTRHDRGLLEISVVNGPATMAANRTTSAGEPLLCGVFAGLVSRLTGESLDCLQTEIETPGVAPARFVVALPERLTEVASAVRRSEPHDGIVELLESVRA